MLDVNRSTVVVEVDTATGKVLRVNVDDEGSTLHPDQDPNDPAVAMAGEAMWPEWRFGF
jgi:hypothetical protein